MSRRDERLAGAARALAPYGFTFDARRAPELRRYEPFVLLAKPEEYVVAAQGTIEGAPVEAYEYGYSSMDSEGHATYHDALVVAVHHPWVNGGASFAPDQKEWGGVAAALDVLFWIPPFTILKAFQYAMAAKNPDREVGDAEFDRLYVVRAASDDDARRAITPALREVCLRLAFGGAVELRPGVLLYSPYAISLDAEHAVHALGIGAAFLGALAPKSAHPMR